MSSETYGPHQVSMEGWISAAPFERLLRMTIAQACAGRATLTMPFLCDYAQGAGLMHGGALVSLADTSVVMAIKSLLPAGSHFATIRLETTFLLPVKKGVVTARARVVSQTGRTIEGEATLYDDQQRAVLEFAATFKIARDTPISGSSLPDTPPPEGTPTKAP